MHVGTGSFVDASCSWKGGLLHIFPGSCTGEGSPSAHEPSPTWMAWHRLARLKMRSILLQTKPSDRRSALCRKRRFMYSFAEVRPCLPTSFRLETTLNYSLKVADLLHEDLSRSANNAFHLLFSEPQGRAAQSRGCNSILLSEFENVLKKFEFGPPSGLAIRSSPNLGCKHLEP